MTNRLAASSVLSCLAALALAGTAFGHADLIASDPPSGGTLTTTPFTLTATFTEELDPGLSSLIVESAAGAVVAHGTVSADYPTLMTAELPTLEPGAYTVRWTSVTPDDQGVERGTFTFNVAASGATPTPAATPAPTAPPAGGSSGQGGDVLIAMLFAGFAIGAVLLLVVLRGRR